MQTDASGNQGMPAGASVLWIGLASELLLLVVLNWFGNLFVPSNAVPFVLFALGAGVCYLVAVSQFGKAGAAQRPGLLWGAAIALRIAVLFMPPGDDLWRYLWEGKIQIHGFNPYLFSPDSPALRALREDWWSAINHRDYAAIYPPGIEWFFAHLVGMARNCNIAPRFLPLIFKSVFALVDLGTIWLLLKLNTGSGRYRATAWYAWNPAVIIAFTGAGHYDSLMLFVMVASILTLQRANPLGQCKPAWGWALFSAVLLGIAISIKQVPLLLLPVWALALGRRSIVLGLSLAIPMGLALLYGGLDVVSHSLAAFVDVSRFNDLLWWLVERSIWPNPEKHNTRYTLILALVIAVLVWVFRRDWRRCALWVMGAALILAPVLHPWYVTWVLPFACWRKTPAWFVFSVTVLLALLAWNNTIFGLAWEPPSVWLRLLMIGPPLAWLVVAWRSKPREIQNS